MNEIELITSYGLIASIDENMSLEQAKNLASACSNNGLKVIQIDAQNKNFATILSSLRADKDLFIGAYNLDLVDGDKVKTVDFIISQHDSLVALKPNAFIKLVHNKAELEECKAIHQALAISVNALDNLKDYLKSCEDEKNCYVVLDLADNLDYIDFMELNNVAASVGEFMQPQKYLEAARSDDLNNRLARLMQQAYCFTVGHVGINAKSAEDAKNINDEIAALFNCGSREIDISYFTGDLVEVMKIPFVGSNGHICVDSCNLKRALAMLKRKGVAFNPDLIIYNKEGKLMTAYLQQEIGGFAFHVRQRVRR